MRKLVLILISTLFLFYCQQKKNEVVSVDGVYKMDSQLIYALANDSLLQTIEAPNQIKIYTDRHYLWIKVSDDSLANFGVGSYKLIENSVVETNMYNSNGVDKPDQYNLNVELTEKGYNQMIPSMKYNGTEIKIDEKYTRMVESAASNFDGLWKATQNYLVTGSDTIHRNYPDFKIYNKGNFSWGVRALIDTANNKYVSYVGTGTFTVEGDLMKETTNIRNVLGSSNLTEAKIIKKADQEFTQAINQANGSVRYTVYSKVQ